MLWKEEMEAAGKPGLAVDFDFFFVSLSLGKWVGGWVGADEWKPRCRDRGFLGLVVGNFRGRGTLRQDLTSDDLGKAKRGFFLAGSG